MASNVGKIRKMAQDIGHGMNNRSAGVYDPGASYPGSDEHHQAERVGKLVLAKCKANGHPQLLIQDQPLSRRPKIARAAHCDYYISHHLNAGGGTGTEVWIPLLAGSAWRRKAELVGKGVSVALGVPWRGVKRKASFAVFNFGARSMIIEYIFCDSKADRLKWEAPGAINKAAVAVTRGLIDGIQDL